MVTTPDGVSVSAGDLDAQVNALQQILDNRARAVENAQQRAHQAVLQARAQQAANQQQERALSLQAASRGLRINSRPNLGVNIPFLGFVGKPGEFSVEPDPENPVFKAMQLEQQIGQTELGQRRFDLEEDRETAAQRESLARVEREMAQIPLATSPAGRRAAESDILSRVDAEVAQAFQERQLQRRQAEASVGATEAQTERLRSEAEIPNALTNLAVDPSGFINRFRELNSPEELAELGIESEEQLESQVRAFAAELQQQGGIPTVDGFRNFLKEGQLRDLEIELQKRQKEQGIELLSEQDRIKARNLKVPTQEGQRPAGIETIDTLISRNAQTSEESGEPRNYQEALEAGDYETLASAFEDSVGVLADQNRIPIEAVRESLAQAVALDVAEKIRSDDRLEVFRDENGLVQVRALRVSGGAIKGPGISPPSEKDFEQAFGLTEPTEDEKQEKFKIHKNQIDALNEFLRKNQNEIDYLLMRQNGS